VSKFLRRGAAAVLPIAAMLAAAPAFAQNDAAAGNADLAAKMGGDNITIGVAGVVIPDYEGSNNSRFTPAPAIIGQFKGFNFSVIGNRATLDLIPNRPGQKIDLQFGPIGVVNFDRGTRKNIDDIRVRNLGKIDNAIELGGYIGIGKTGVITSPYDKISASVSYRHDVSNVHDSGIWQPSINYLTPLSRKAAVGLTASAQHVERGYARTYFSISPAQSLSSGLPTYNARAGWKNYQLGGYVAYSLTGDLLHGVKLIAGGAYSRLLGSYSYSPIVRTAGSPNQWLGAAGLAYTF
jgi:MipA family protein